MSIVSIKLSLNKLNPYRSCIDGYIFRGVVRLGSKEIVSGGSGLSGIISGSSISRQISILVSLFQSDHDNGISTLFSSFFLKRLDHTCLQMNLISLCRNETDFFILKSDR